MGSQGSMNAPEGGTGVNPVKVFIGYRRSDTAGYAGWLHHSLDHEYGRAEVFRDVVAISIGTDFTKAVERWIRRCDVFLCLIGPEWASPEGRRRLAEENDAVRVEVETALRLKREVIPILLQKARMPQARDLPPALEPLTVRNALEMSDGKWMEDLRRLTDRLEEVRAQRAAGTKMLGQEIYDRFSRKDRPPTWVGRTGGSTGKMFKEDVRSGRWRDQAYEVRFGGGEPSKNWFRASEFVSQVDQSQPR